MNLYPWVTAPANVKLRIRLVFWHVLHLLLADKVAVAILDADSYSLCFDRLPRRFFLLVRHIVTVIVQQLPNPIPEKFVPCQDHSPAKIT